MAETGAVFGGEHSAHYYFRDFWRADTGMLAALHVLAALGEQDRPLSRAGRRRTSATSASGEINSTVADQAGATRRGARRRSPTATASTVDELDGLTVDLADGGWFNLRAVQHRAAAAAQRRGRGPRPRWPALRDEVLALIRGRHAVPMRDLTPCELDPLLLEILACPDCHAPLRGATRRPASCVCTSATCGLPTRCATTSRCCCIDEATPGPPVTAATMQAADERRRSTSAARRRRRRWPRRDRAACCARSPRAGAQVRRRCRGRRGRRAPAVADDGRPRAVVVAGSGGSAHRRRRARRGRRAGLPGARSGRAREHRLPGWVGPVDLVVAVSLLRRQPRRRSPSPPRPLAAAAGCSPSARRARRWPTSRRRRPRPSTCRSTRDAPACRGRPCGRSPSRCCMRRRRARAGRRARGRPVRGRRRARRGWPSAAGRRRDASSTRPRALALELAGYAPDRLGRRRRSPASRRPRVAASSPRTPSTRPCRRAARGAPRPGRGDRRPLRRRWRRRRRDDIFRDRGRRRRPAGAAAAAARAARRRRARPARWPPRPTVDDRARRAVRRGVASCARRASTALARLAGLVALTDFAAIYLALVPGSTRRPSPPIADAEGRRPPRDAPDEQPRAAPGRSSPRWRPTSASRSPSSSRSC